jgi:hypothetical protein
LNPFSQNDKGRSQYHHEPCAARKRRVEIRKRARPFAVIMAELLQSDFKIPTGWRRAIISTATEHNHTALFPAKDINAALEWIQRVREEGFNGWDFRGNVLHISEAEITQIKVLKGSSGT